MKLSTSIGLIVFTIMYKSICCRIISKYPNLGLSLMVLPAFSPLFIENVEVVECSILYGVYNTITICEALLADTN